jgi:hypothetical protein
MHPSKWRSTISGQAPSWGLVDDGTIAEQAQRDCCRGDGKAVNTVGDQTSDVEVREKPGETGAVLATVAGEYPSNAAHWTREGPEKAASAR